LSIAARNWLLEQSREELEARGLHVRKGLDLSKLTDYDMHVHYHNETVGKVLAASPIYLALISAITGWRPDPTVRHAEAYYLVVSALYIYIYIYIYYILYIYIYNVLLALTGGGRRQRGRRQGRALYLDGRRVPSLRPTCWWR
jgi:hypothetical protein